MIRLGTALMAAGGIMIAIPDSDDRLFSFSRSHGPSALDAVGIALSLVGWAVLLRVGWSGRRAVVRSRGFAAGLVVFAVGVVLLTLSVTLDLGWWWVAGAGLMALAQAVALGVAAQAAKSP